MNNIEALKALEEELINLDRISPFISKNQKIDKLNSIRKKLNKNILNQEFNYRCIKKANKIINLMDSLSMN